MRAYEAMRVMDLPDARIPSDQEEGIGLYRARLSSSLRTPSVLSQTLLAYMTWPDDKHSRNSWMASVIARRLAHGEKLPISHPIKQFGGLEAVTGEAFNAVSSRLTAETKRWAPVADVLQMVVDLHHSGLPLSGGASVSKAIELCADDETTLSVGHMRRLWSLFRDVAHLLAAGALLAREVPEGGGSIFSAAWYAPESLLAISAGFEIFGLDFVAHSQIEPLLSRRNTWRLPSYCIPERPWLQHRALSDRQKQVLIGYKAVKAYQGRN
jgi:hypothetical protein